MKIEIRKTKEEGIIQITTLDERWYQDGDVFRPSSSWIASYYPKGIQFYKWLAEKGWDEAEAIKNAAGNKGSRVHQGAEKLLLGETLKMDDKVKDENGEAEYSVVEWEALMSFSDWYKEENPKRIIAIEQVAVSRKYNYAGTLDLYYEKQDGRIGILDIKTSPNIWPEMELQLSSYKQAVEEVGDKVDFVEILQVGYRLNKRKWKITEVEDKFNLFLAARQIWESENKDVQPKQRDYPVKIVLEASKLPPVAPKTQKVAKDTSN
jgi:hypothetical protein